MQAIHTLGEDRRWVSKIGSRGKGGSRGAAIGAAIGAALGAAIGAVIGHSGNKNYAALPCREPNCALAIDSLAYGMFAVDDAYGVRRDGDEQIRLHYGGRIWVPPTTAVNNSKCRQ